MDGQAQKYLEHYLSTLKESQRGGYTTYSADYFCADPESANSCAELIRRGLKVATCSLKYWYQFQGEPWPRQGHLQVVTDWYGNPSSIIEVTAVSECRYCDIDEEFARAEGEGDLSLAWWRQVHWQFFAAECSQLGIAMVPEIMLVTERFRVVYQEC